MTDVIRVDPEHPSPSAIATAAECLRNGGLVAFPTETVYGLGVHALDRAAVRRLFEAKKRPATDPLIVHLASIDALGAVTASVPDSARALAARFWPGPLTLVLPRAAVVPDEVTAGLSTVAVRIPSHPIAHALIAAAAVPVAAPSANLFSRPSPTQAAHVLEDLGGRIDLVIDGGSTSIGVESTVVDLSGEIPTVLRPGAVTIEMLRAVLPNVRAHAQAGPGAAAATSAEEQPMPSPGMLQRHYSPRAELTLFEGSRDAALAALLAAARTARATGRIVGVLAADNDRVSIDAFDGGDGGLVVRTLGSFDAPEAVAARLYAVLRELDALGVDLILVRGLPDVRGLGAAVQDRLRRAAAGRIVRA